MGMITQIKVGSDTHDVAVPYAVCGTAAGTAEKAVTYGNFSLVTGSQIKVKFTYENTASSPKLNVNSTGAKTIVAYGTTGMTTSWKAGSVVDFTYDGANWVETGFGALNEQTPAFDGGGLSAGGAIGSVTAPTVTVSETGTFTNSTNMTNYGITTTKPSGTDGTNYLTIDDSITENNGSVKGSKTITRAAVLYNGAVNGYVNKADNTQALAADSTGVTVSVDATVDPAVTDNFEPYYINIVSPSFDGGGMTGDDIGGSQTKGSVTIAESGTFFSQSDYGVTTTKPSGTDGTDYFSIDETHAAASGTATGSTTITRADVAYNGAVHGAVNKADNTVALSGGTKTVSASITVTPSVTDNFETYYVPKSTTTATAGTASASASIAKQPSASTTASSANATTSYAPSYMSNGISSSATNYWIKADSDSTSGSASAASGYSTASASATGGSASVTKGLTKAASATGAASGDKSATSTEVTASSAAKTASATKTLYLKAATASATNGTASVTTEPSASTTDSSASAATSYSTSYMSNGISSSATNYWIKGEASSTSGSASANSGVITATGGSASVTAGYTDSNISKSGTTATTTAKTASSAAKTASDSKTLYLKAATVSKTDGTASATANAGTASISKDPGASASASATQTGMADGVSTTATNYYFTSSASASSNSGVATATGGSARAYVTASSASVTAGYTDSGTSTSTSGSDTGTKTGNTATTTEKTASKSDSSTVYLKAATPSSSASITTTPKVTVAMTPTMTSGAISDYGITSTKPSSGTYATFDPGASVTTTGVATSYHAAGAGYEPGHSSTAGGTANITPTITDGTTYYTPVVTPAFDGGGMTGSDISDEQTEGSVTIEEDGTFFSQSDYGVTTTKPSGTDGTDYFSVHETHTLSSGTATGSTTITRAAVLYNGAKKGLIGIADNTTALASDTKSVSASITVTPSVTDNFESYYIPVTSLSIDESTAATDFTISLSPSVTPSPTASAAGSNITLGTVATSAPSSGRYIIVTGGNSATTGTTAATGKRKVSSGAGAIASSSKTIGASATASAAKSSTTVYYPIDSSSVSVSDTSLSVSPSVDPTPVASASGNISLTAVSSAPSSGYYIKAHGGNSKTTGNATSGESSTVTWTKGYTDASTSSTQKSISSTATATANAKSTDQYYTIPKGDIGASGTITASGSGSVTPGTNTISKNSNTNVSVGTVSTTKPSSGYYVAVDAKAAATSDSTGVTLSGSGAISVTVSTAGYVSLTDTGSGSVDVTGTATVTVNEKSAATTYFPITSAAYTTSTSSNGGTSKASITPLLGTSTQYVNIGAGYTPKAYCTVYPAVTDVDDKATLDTLLSSSAGNTNRLYRYTGTSGESSQGNLYTYGNIYVYSGS